LFLAVNSSDSGDLSAWFCAASDSMGRACWPRAPGPWHVSSELEISRRRGPTRCGRERGRRRRWRCARRVRGSRPRSRGSLDRSKPPIYPERRGQPKGAGGAGTRERDHQEGRQQNGERDLADHGFTVALRLGTLPIEGKAPYNPTRDRARAGAKEAMPWRLTQHDAENAAGRDAEAAPPPGPEGGRQDDWRRRRRTSEERPEPT